MMTGPRASDILVGGATKQAILPLSVGNDPHCRGSRSKSGHIDRIESDSESTIDAAAPEGGPPVDRWWCATAGRRTIHGEVETYLKQLRAV